MNVFKRILNVVRKKEEKQEAPLEKEAIVKPANTVKEYDVEKKVIKKKFIHINPDSNDKPDGVPSFL